MFDATGLIEKRNRNGNVYYEDTFGDIIAKACSKCKRVKILGCFGNNKRGFGGKAVSCKECVSSYDKERNLRDKEKRRACQKRYVENNKECIRLYKKKYRELNKETIKEYQRERYENNRELYSIYRHRRRTREKMLPISLTPEIANKMLKQQGGRCILTGASRKTHLEHFIPLSVGYGGTTFENCYYMDGSLNFSKSFKNPFEWIKTQPSEYQDRFHSILVPMLAARNEMTVEEFTEYVNWCFENPRTIEDLQKVAN